MGSSKPNKTDAEERLPVQCGVVTLDVRRCRGTIRQLAFETQRVAIGGNGSADLNTESIDVVLTPVLKEATLFSLQRSIHVSGKLRAPTVALVERVAPRSDAPRCASAANPLTPVVALPVSKRDTYVHISRLASGASSRASSSNRP